MKKGIAFVLSIIMIASFLIFPAFAAPGNQNYGNVKKISDSDINMQNGDRDAAWDYALAIPVETGDPDNAHGTTWVLWSDTAFYFYTEVLDSTPVNLDIADDGEYWDAWTSDSVEIFISVEGDTGNLDVTTPGNFDDHCWQFRIDRNGMPSTYQRDGAWTDDFLIGSAYNKSRFEWAVKQDGNKYYTKHKITFLGAPKPGELGLQVQINDLLEEGGSAPQTRANDASGSWDADQFGFVVLVDEPAMPVVVEEEVATDAPAVDEPAPITEQQPPPEVIVITPTAPTTGDFGIVIFTMMIFAASASIFAVRSKKAKK